MDIRIIAYSHYQMSTECVINITNFNFDISQLKYLGSKCSNTNESILSEKLVHLQSILTYWNYSSFEIFINCVITQFSSPLNDITPYPDSGWGHDSDNIYSTFSHHLSEAGLFTPPHFLTCCIRASFWCEIYI